MKEREMMGGTQYTFHIDRIETVDLSPEKSEETFPRPEEEDYPDDMIGMDFMKINDNCIKHRKLCAELTELYRKKNHDYGDIFHETYLKFGLTMVLIRLTDKLKRFETLTTSKAQVKDESIRDTLINLADYAIMAVMELDRNKELKPE